MEPGVNLLQQLLPLMLLINRVTSLDICDSANFTVVNATPEDHLVTVSKSTILTFACWTWCGYVDWSTIEFSAAAAEQTGASQYTCRGEAGPCMPSRENPTCTGIQPGRDSVLKFELSLRVKDTFYIECLPQCTFQMADKQVGRTKGLLVRVTDPPTSSAVTPTSSSSHQHQLTSTINPTSSLVSPTSSVSALPVIISSSVPDSQGTSPSVIPTRLTSQSSSIVATTHFPTQTPRSEAVTAATDVTANPLFPFMTVFFFLFVVVLILFVVILIVLLYTRTKHRTQTELLDKEKSTAPTQTSISNNYKELSKV